MLVLIIGHDNAMLRTIEELFTEHDWRMAHAVDHESALAHFQQEVPDAVVCDLDVPGNAGAELIAVLSDQYPQVPVVVTTGHGSERAAVECFRAGAADYVVKSDLADEIVAVLHRLHHEQLSPTIAAPPQPASELPDVDKSVENGADQRAGPVGQKQEDTPPPSPSLRDEYDIKPWALAHLGLRDGIGRFSQAGMTISSKRLLVLRRQMARLVRWSQLGGQPTNEHRRHPRSLLGSIVTMYPLDADGIPRTSDKFESFCKDLSAGGCSLLHNRAFTEKQWIISLITQSNHTLISLRCRIVRQRPLSLGMYDIGMHFLQRVENPA